MKFKATWRFTAEASSAEEAAGKIMTAMHSRLAELTAIVLVDRTGQRVRVATPAMPAPPGNGASPAAPTVSVVQSPRPGTPGFIVTPFGKGLEAAVSGAEGPCLFPSEQKAKMIATAMSRQLRPLTFVVTPVRVEET